MSVRGVAMLAQAKGQRQLTNVFTLDADEARAIEVAGIDILTTPHTETAKIREAAPTPLLVAGMGVNDPQIVSLDDALRVAFAAMQAGADAIYTGLSLAIVEGLAREHVPVFGHVGYVPYRQGWFGGPRAVGKTEREAERVLRETQRYEDAGAVAVEMELVPEAVAGAVTRAVGLSVLSMGSGAACDGQYLFACDILGTGGDWMPRHARRYADLKRELDKVQAIRIDAMTRFRSEVTEGLFPTAKNTIRAEAAVADHVAKIAASRD